MSTESRQRERELVLAPNEYAYVLDTTKGHINCYVGPFKTSLAQTDQPVAFNDRSKHFEPVEMQQAVRLFATAPANWYVVLKNPARDNGHPKPGTANAGSDLEVGAKINLKGPVSFPLWPGQMAQVIRGHRLKFNQYLYVRIHDPEQARESWRGSLSETRDGSDPAELPQPRFVTGENRIIRGTDVAFYIPPTGVEVIPDEEGRYVRDAVTLQRLEYCVLVRDDGTKRYVRGEAVVFPEPDEQFVESGGRRKFKAIELNEVTGLYVKVIAPYTDEEGVEHREGEELFLTGKDKIYFPRQEHAIIRYGDHELHHAIAVPRGEGRYVLDRLSGEVELVRGPRMFLPDPRQQVVTRRVLSEREVRLLYPGNEEALAYNRGLRRRIAGSSAAEVAEALAGPAPAKRPRKDAGEAEGGDERFGGSGFTRTTEFSGPRTITLDNKYEGAVTVDVWSGYAVQVVNRAGGRRVVVGPDRVLLGYDETLEALSLSRGRPKGSEPPLPTVYLRVTGNKVADVVELTTRDMVRGSLTVSYRVSFEGDPERWFAVDDYVKLLCDHASSMLKATARRASIRELREGVTELVREALLGPRAGEGGARPGLSFAENGMRVFDVEVLELEVVDVEVEELLSEAQTRAVQAAVQVAEKEALLENQRRVEAIERSLAQEAHATKQLKLELEQLAVDARHAQAARQATQETELMQLQRRQELEEAALQSEIAERRRTTRQAEHGLELQVKQDQQRLVLEELRARVQGAVEQAQAYSPQLVLALNRLGDEQLLSALAKNFGELAAVEGRGLLETAKKFLDFAPATLLPMLKEEPGNGKKPS